MILKTILPDLKSGIVVFLVALPLCLGIALACNVPLFSGLISGVIGGIAVTALSSSALSVSGPAAGLTAVILSASASLGSFEALLAAILCAGILQIVFGLLKAGNISSFIPISVIKGMLAGIGIILIIKQLPHMVGYDKDPEGDFNFEQPDGHNTLSELVYMLNSISPGAIIIGVTSLLILLLSNTKFYKNNIRLSNVPGPLVVVVIGILLNIGFRSYQNFELTSEQLVILPNIKSLTDLKEVSLFPDFSQIMSYKFLIIVVTLAMVASLESLLSLEATDKLDPLKRDSDSNKELIAQGVGNILCGLAGALPVTAVIVRSSANINSGAKTKLSAIIHAVLLLGSVLLIPNILMLIPNSALAAILIMTGYKLTQISLFTALYKKGWDQFLPFIITVIVMLLTDLLKGVGAGVVVAVIFIIRANIRISFDVAEQLINGKRHYLIKLPTHVTFFNKGFLKRYLDSIKSGSRVIIDGTINKSTDKEVIEVILEFIWKSKEKKIEIEQIKCNF
ncbi:MAG: sulfate transporter family protein [Bacteroidetes bacterium]|nr:sulfate transporter family protein [Bacteroidota bacterium]